MVAIPANEKDDLRRVLDDDGVPLSCARIPAIPDTELTRMFEVMLLTRLLDDLSMRLAREGRLGFGSKSIGADASHFAAAPLRETDWVFPGHREQGAWLWRGYSLQQYVDQLLGNADDPAKGRQTPMHHSARWLNLVSISSPVGTQIPQAVGAAYAARAAGKDDVVMTFFGGGATSTGEFHVGMNFAAVWKAPCVFVCRNLASQISGPSARQRAARTVAGKALGYGMPGVRVDGNDVLAVWQVASEAIARARAGGGPTLIEALTHRVHGHASSADPAIDRDPPEPESPASSGRRDPLRRLRGYLQHRAVWSEAWEAQLVERYTHEVSEALAAAEAKPLPAVETLFDDVYEQLPWHLREQREQLLALPRTLPPPPPHRRGPG